MKITHNRQKLRMNMSLAFGKSHLGDHCVLMLISGIFKSIDASLA